VQKKKTDGWVASVLSVDPFFGYDVAAYRISPILEAILALGVIFAPWELGRNLRSHIAQSKAKITDRMQREPLRKDFCSYLFEMKEKLNFSEMTMIGYSNAMILAGSGTTSVTLCALTHWLCRNKDSYAQLKKEIRSRFQSPEDITSESAASVQYLTAVIHEALRMFPPFPFVPPRITPQGGETVAGTHIPGGVSLKV
jgi:cytochrome P450